jgi:hypothetical protein
MLTKPTNEDKCIKHIINVVLLPQVSATNVTILSEVHYKDGYIEV